MENVEMWKDYDWVGTQGCKVDRDKLRASLKDTEAEYLLDHLEKVGWDIGKAIHNKLSVWYIPEDTRCFLYACLDSMENLAEYYGRNTIRMKGPNAEPNMPYKIEFYKNSKGKPRVDLHFPMWTTVKVKRDQRHSRNSNADGPCL